jgi:hypothetical protein
MDIRKKEWWFWLGLLICLGYGLFVHPRGFLWALLYQAIHLQTYVFIDKSFTSFSVQIRLAILGLLLLGQIPGMGWLYWIPLLGISARNLTGYCLMARLMSLLPWNRKEPLTADLVKRRLFSAPTKDSILNG